MMRSSGQCPHCQSTEVLPNITIIDRGQYDDTNKPLTVGVFRKPDALLFKDLFQASLRAWICGSCGYAELFVDEPGALLEAYRQGSAS